MAEATDEAGIQFRILNSSKGPAVRATRAQADRVLYRQAIRRRLENQPNLWLFQQAVDDLIVEGDRVVGAVTQLGLRFRSRAVVLTAGTFLNGLVHVGLSNYSGGRAGDPPSLSLAAAPARTEASAGSTEDRHAAAHRRPDDRLLQLRGAARRPRSGAGVLFPRRSGVAPAPAAVLDHAHATRAPTRSSAAGLDRSPMYTGVIEGVGPRYCPSVEDKIHRFADKSSHQVFLEPEGLDTHEFYPNGISTSLPFDVQLELVHSIPGPGERAHPAPGLRDRVRLLRPARPEALARDPGDRRPVLRRPDQRHDRLRGGGRPGAAGRHQRGAAGPGPRQPGARAATRPTSACWSTT